MREGIICFVILHLSIYLFKKITFYLFEVVFKGKSELLNIPIKYSLTEYIVSYAILQSLKLVPLAFSLYFFLFFFRL